MPPRWLNFRLPFPAPTRAMFERGSAHRTEQGPVGCIPVWEFAKKATDARRRERSAGPTVAPGCAQPSSS
ncbi:hypothetical protein MRF4_01200 [Methylobacterium radiotolerans]